MHIWIWIEGPRIDLASSPCVLRVNDWEFHVLVLVGTAGCGDATRSTSSSGFSAQQLSWAVAGGKEEFKNSVFVKHFLTAVLRAQNGMCMHFGPKIKYHV